MAEFFLERLSTAPEGFAFGLVLLILFFCGLGIPLPEEIPLTLAGYLVYTGDVSLPTATIWCLIAILAGDSVLFALGFRFGHRIFEIRLFRKLLTPRRMKKVNRYFHRYGNRVVFLGRFMAGVRATFFLTAGILKMPYRRFLVLDGVAALISAPIFIFLAYRFGGELEMASQLFHEFGWYLLAGAVILVVGTSIFIRQRRKRKRAEARLASEQSKEEPRFPVLKRADSEASSTPKSAQEGT